jgi:hypothetical protein
VKIFLIWIAFVSDLSLSLSLSVSLCVYVCLCVCVCVCVEGYSVSNPGSYECKTHDLPRATLHPYLNIVMEIWYLAFHVSFSCISAYVVLMPAFHNTFLPCVGYNMVFSPQSNWLLISRWKIHSINYLLLQQRLKPATKWLEVWYGNKAHAYMCETLGSIPSTLNKQINKQIKTNISKKNVKVKESCII